MSTTTKLPNRSLIDGLEHIPQVDEITGVVTLARNALREEAGANETLSAAWSALDMALHSLRELRYDLEGVPREYRWNEAERIRAREESPS